MMPPDTCSPSTVEELLTEHCTILKDMVHELSDAAIDAQELADEWSTQENTDRLATASALLEDLRGEAESTLREIKELTHGETRSQD